MMLKQQLPNTFEKRANVVATSVNQLTVAKAGYGVDQEFLFHVMRHAGARLAKSERVRYDGAPGEQPTNTDRDRILAACGRAVLSQKPGTWKALWSCVDVWCRKTKMNAVLEIDPVAVLAVLDNDFPGIRPDPQNEASIKQQFLLKWLHPDIPEPRISAVFKVVCADQVLKGFKKRVKAVKDRMKAQNVRPYEKNAGPGNTLRRFHGTKRRCNLGETSNIPCTDEDCNVCSILRNGFRLPKAENLRFGKGIYSTATSSKANDYTDNHRQIHAVLVVNVAAGRVDKTCDSWTPKHMRMTQPGKGYDSVVGEVPPLWETPAQVAQIENKLNYDELVVYTPNAIRATHLILYEL